MEVLLQIALLVTDPDSALYPAVHPGDYALFGNPPRLAVRDRWCYSVRVRDSYKSVDPDLWHMNDRRHFDEACSHANLVEQAWDALDYVSMYLLPPNYNQEYVDYGYRQYKVTYELQRLRRLLGPVDYYAGKMPDVPQGINVEP